MKKVNHFAVGAFIIGSVSLVILGIIIFGSSRLFSPTLSYTVSFDKSVKGLSKGAPVMFRGIKIGEIESIQLSCTRTDDNPNDNTVVDRTQWPISVTLCLYPKALSFDQGAHGSILETLSFTQESDDMEQWMLHMITREGMRASLNMQSLLTGLLYVELDVYPDEEPLSEEKKRLAYNHVIPTHISSMEKLSSTLEETDFGAHIEKVWNVFDGAAEVFEEGKVNEIVENLRDTSQEIKIASQTLNVLLEQAKGQVPAILSDAAVVTKDVRSVVTDVKPRAKNIAANLEVLSRELAVAANLSNGPLAECLKELRALMNQLRKSAENADQVMGDLHGVLKPGRGVAENAVRVTEDFRETLLKINQLIEMLNNSPEVLIRGK